MHRTFPDQGFSNCDPKNIVCRVTSLLYPVLGKEPLSKRGHFFTEKKTSVLGRPFIRESQKMTPFSKLCPFIRSKKHKEPYKRIDFSHIRGHIWAFSYKTWPYKRIPQYFCRQLLIIGNGQLYATLPDLAVMAVRLTGTLAPGWIENTPPLCAHTHTLSSTYYTIQRFYIYF